MRGCDDLFCHDGVCQSYIDKRFHAAWVKVECLSAAITQRQTEADGPHIRRDGPESERTAWFVSCKGNGCCAPRAS